jgi:glycogen operon protein
MVGNFPVLWSEWNGKYRDCVRRFWKGDGGTAGELAGRLAGSSDLYEYSGRAPHASVNFITCHDGFNLEDLVSYNEKHNEANGEDNRDGASHNDSWNCGAEGPTEDAGILALRARQKRNLMAALLLSQGVPMILAGDELGHTQQGNNNVYCQDNELSWLDWEPLPERLEFLDFVRQLIRLRRENAAFQRRRFFQGRPLRGHEIKDIYWIEPTGEEMTDEDWAQPYVRCLGVGLVGGRIDELDEFGKRIRGDSFLLLLNAHHEPIPFTVPTGEDAEWHWERVVDTADPGDERPWEPGEDRVYPLEARSMAVLCLVQVRPARPAPAATVPAREKAPADGKGQAKPAGPDPQPQPATGKAAAGKPT